MFNSKKINILRQKVNEVVSEQNKLINRFDYIKYLLDLAKNNDTFNNSSEKIDLLAKELGFRFEKEDYIEKDFDPFSKDYGKKVVQQRFKIVKIKK